MSFDPIWAFIELSARIFSEYNGAEETVNEQWGYAPGILKEEKEWEMFLVLRPDSQLRLGSCPASPSFLPQTLTPSPLLG